MVYQVLVVLEVGVNALARRRRGMQEDHSSFFVRASWPANLYVRPAEIPVPIERRSQRRLELIRELLAIHSTILLNQAEMTRC